MGPLLVDLRRNKSLTDSRTQPELIYRLVWRYTCVRQGLILFCYVFGDSKQGLVGHTAGSVRKKLSLTVDRGFYF